MASRQPKLLKIAPFYCYLYRNILKLHSLFSSGVYKFYKTIIINTFIHGPVLVVEMLSYEGVGLDCAVRVHFWHIHVVNEIDQFLGSRWTVVTT